MQETISNIPSDHLLPEVTGSPAKARLAAKRKQSGIGENLSEDQMRNWLMTNDAEALKDQLEERIKKETEQREADELREKFPSRTQINRYGGTIVKLSEIPTTLHEDKERAA